MKKKRKLAVADENVIRKQCNSCGATWTPETPGFDVADAPARCTVYGRGVLEFYRCVNCYGSDGR